AGHVGIRAIREIRGLVVKRQFPRNPCFGEGAYA
ncbi:MAG: hypothetical protein QOG31_636, partial [Thermoplasmata archaeon]|nr:hypothetical protein [Thermoplasmata archaeon]